VKIMSVCMCVITKHFRSRSLLYSKTVSFPLLCGSNNVRDQIRLNIKLMPVCCGHSKFLIKIWFCIMFVVYDDSGVKMYHDMQTVTF
jgi:hypothetical protein